MNIAIIGFYHHQNAGDDRFMHVWTRLLEGHQLTFLCHTDNWPLSFLRSFDLLILGGGGVVIANYGIWSRLPRLLTRGKPAVMIAGLEINHVEPEAASIARQLLDRACFVSLRHGPTDPSAVGLVRTDQIDTDLTWIAPLRVDRRPVRGRVAFNLAPCTWRPFDSRAWIDAVAGRDIACWPLFFGGDRDVSVLRQGHLTTCPQEFSLEPLATCEQVVAARYHAITFALQNRIPCVAIAYDHKVENLMRAFGLDAYVLQTDEPHKLHATLERLSQNSREIQLVLAQKAAEHEARARDMAQRIQRAVAEMQQSIQTVSGFDRVLTRARNMAARWA